jgi:transposase InsO family protein
VVRAPFFVYDTTHCINCRESPGLTGPAGLIGSIGTVGDALDNVLCETTIGLYKTECVREGSPFRTGSIRTLADLEDMTSAWVSWYNTARLMHRLGPHPTGGSRGRVLRSNPGRKAHRSHVTMCA